MRLGWLRAAVLLHGQENEGWIGKRRVGGDDDEAFQSCARTAVAVVSRGGLSEVVVLPLFLKMTSLFLICQANHSYPSSHQRRLPQPPHPDELHAKPQYLRKHMNSAGSTDSMV